jgi:predicted nucleic acid-binding protein
MAFVLDASMVAAWLMPDEQTPETDALLDLLRETPALAPDLLRHEIRSLFLAAVKRQRVRAAILNHPPLPDFSRRSVFRFREAVWSL